MYLSVFETVCISVFLSQLCFGYYCIKLDPLLKDLMTSLIDEMTSNNISTCTVSFTYFLIYNALHFQAILFYLQKSPTEFYTSFVCFSTVILFSAVFVKIIYLILLKTLQKWLAITRFCPRYSTHGKRQLCA